MDLFFAAQAEAVSVQGVDPIADPNVEVTYVSRGFEEYRGFPQVMQAISELQKMRPNCTLIAGSDVVAYGAQRSDGISWKTWAEKELPLDPLRTHWLGAVQESDYHSLLACSDVHFYLTVPLSSAGVF